MINTVRSNAKPLTSTESLIQVVHTTYFSSHWHEKSLDKTDATVFPGNNEISLVAEVVFRTMFIYAEGISLNKLRSTVSS